MRTIALTNGSSMIVDDDDYEWASKLTWTFSNGYAMTTWKHTNIYGMEVRRPTTFHRIVMGMATDKTHRVVDHVNRNRLDNRKANLRVTSQADNCRNSRHYDKLRANPDWCISQRKGRRTFQIYIRKKYYGEAATREEARNVRDSILAQT